MKKVKPLQLYGARTRHMVDCCSVVDNLRAVYFGGANLMDSKMNFESQVRNEKEGDKIQGTPQCKWCRSVKCASYPIVVPTHST